MRIPIPVAVLLAAFAALAAVTVALLIVAPPSSARNSVGVAPLVLPFAIVGVLIVNRKPGNPIGWIFVAVAFLTVFGLDAALYSVMAYREGYHLPASRLALFLAPAWVPVLTLIPAPIGLFPDGRIPRGRWRWAFWLYVALAAAFATSIVWSDRGSFTERTPKVNTSGELAAVTSNGSGLDLLLNNLAAGLYLVLFAAMIVYQLLQFRRAAGDERQQRKWFLAGGSIGVTGVLLASVFEPLGFLFPFVIALPIGMGVGILKYRLYDIDRLISRTISYAILTALLAGVFVGIIVVGTDVLPLSSPVAVAASTLAAAALFNPLRRRIQRVIDRRFNRARYDAQATVAAFTGRLRNAIDPESINIELLRVVDQTIAPAHASLWVRPRDDRQPA
jgi:hypothetical protein